MKRKVIAELDSLAAEDIMITSNSRSYACSEILESMKMKKKGRILSAHRNEHFPSSIGYISYH